MAFRPKRPFPFRLNFPVFFINGNKVLTLELVSEFHEQLNPFRFQPEMAFPSLLLWNSLNYMGRMS